MLKWFVERGIRLGLGQLSIDVESKDGGNESQRQDKDDDGVTKYRETKKKVDVKSSFAPQGPNGRVRGGTLYEGMRDNLLEAPKIEFKGWDPPRTLVPFDLQYSQPLLLTVKQGKKKAARWILQDGTYTRRPGESSV